MRPRILRAVVDEPLHVVFVCTGNRFRSALAAAVFREEAGGAANVESYGTLDIGAAPTLEQAVAEAARLGYDLSRHVSRPLHGVDLSHAHLVLGFERAHVAAAVVDAGAAPDRSFTLPELVNLITPAATPREAIAHAAAARASPTSMEMPELEDPFGTPPAVQRRIADDVCELTRRLALVLWSAKVGRGAA